MTSKAMRAAALLMLAMAAGGCSIFNKGPKKTPVLGDRVAVLSAESGAQVDPALAALPMNLPAPVANAQWAQPGGNAQKSMGHLALGGTLGQAFAVSAGQGSTLKARLASPPVVAGDHVFTIDTNATVRAFNAQTGAQLWQSRFGVDKGNEASLYGGGIAYDSGRIYATNGLGYVAALDERNGGLIWQVRPGGPLRGAPTVAYDSVYVMSQDNQIYALRTSNGERIWEGAASLEIAGVFGSASPAVAQGTVVAGFSSGELNAFRYENGRALWQDTLSRTSVTTTSVSSLSDIDAHPVIDNGQVFSVGQGGRMVALELLSGQRMWEINIAGISTPWVAGDWVFVVTDEGKLMAVARTTGRVRWITELPQFRKEKSKRGLITYAGPILAGNRLIVVSSQGAIISVDPTNGAVQGQTAVGTGISLAPVVANSTLYVLDNDGRLRAFR
ncbi:PQQ-binding-like beta-propeller repeat protein [Sphingomonas piscis]|nr:PQQ-binding-like beta-propeller repeat protein [Sphingomonas piscis]